MRTPDAETRRYRIAAQLARGRSPTQIARQLHCSRQTVYEVKNALAQSRPLIDRRRFNPGSRALRRLLTVLPSPGTTTTTTGLYDDLLPAAERDQVRQATVHNTVDDEIILLRLAIRHTLRAALGSPDAPALSSAASQRALQQVGDLVGLLLRAQRTRRAISDGHSEEHRQLLIAWQRLHGEDENGQPLAEEKQ
jgi:hypothetical protein